MCEQADSLCAAVLSPSPNLHPGGPGPPDPSSDVAPAAPGPTGPVFGGGAAHPHRNAGRNG